MKDNNPKVKISINFSTYREIPVSVQETIISPQEKKDKTEEESCIKTPTPILTASYPSF